MLLDICRYSKYTFQELDVELLLVTYQGGFYLQPPWSYLRAKTSEYSVFFIFICLSILTLFFGFLVITSSFALFYC